MQTKEFDFEFTHERRKYNANLQIMKPFKTTMYRVRVDKVGKQDAVFIFYEINEAGKRFYHFPMEELKRQMAVSILKELKHY